MHCCRSTRPGRKLPSDDRSCRQTSPAGFRTRVHRFGHGRRTPVISPTPRPVWRSGAVSAARVHFRKCTVPLEASAGTYCDHSLCPGPDQQPAARRLAWPMTILPASPPILVVNGPNLNMLGTREPHLYGTTPCTMVIATSWPQRRADASLEIVAFQSNHEGAIVDFLQEQGRVSRHHHQCRSLHPLQLRHSRCTRKPARRQP